MSPRAFVPFALSILAAGCLLGPADGLDEGGDGLEGGGGEGIPPNAYCDPVADWDADAAAAELRVLALVNDARAAGSLCGGVALQPTRALVMNGALRCAAREHSLDMAERGFFDHLDPDGEDPGDRILKAGYVFTIAGENIAAGHPTPEEAVDGWLASPGHCANIMSPDFFETGVGYVESPDAAYPSYWTQTFGTR